MYFNKSVFELQKTHEVQIRKYTARACVAGQGRVYPAVAAGHYYTRYEESYIHGSTVGTELRDALVQLACSVRLRLPPPLGLTRHGPFQPPVRTDYVPSVSSDSSCQN